MFPLSSFRAIVLAVAGLLVFMCEAGAQNLDTVSLTSTAASSAEFRVQADRLRASMDKGGSNADIEGARRDRVLSLLDSIQALFDGHVPPATLDDGDRLQVVNAQMEINAILARREDQRVVCEFVMQTGSHRRTKRCLMQKQRAEIRAESQEALRTNERSAIP